MLHFRYLFMISIETYIHKQVRASWGRSPCMCQPLELAVKGITQVVSVCQPQNSDHGQSPLVSDTPPCTTLLYISWSHRELFGKMLLSSNTECFPVDLAAEQRSALSSRSYITLTSLGWAAADHRSVVMVTVKTTDTSRSLGLSA